jgi:hypothetical protein
VSENDNNDKDSERDELIRTMMLTELFTACSDQSERLVKLLQPQAAQITPEVARVRIHNPQNSKYNMLVIIRIMLEIIFKQANLGPVQQCPMSNYYYVY